MSHPTRKRKPKSKHQQAAFPAVIEVIARVGELAPSWWPKGEAAQHLASKPEMQAEALLVAQKLCELYPLTPEQVAKTRETVANTPQALAQGVIAYGGMLLDYLAAAAVPTVRTAFAEFARVRTEEMLALAPEWMKPTREEKQQAIDLVKRVLGDHPTATPSELLWCYAIERDRPHLAGRKPKWTTTFKALLALEVDVALAARGEIATTKNLPLIFEEMQKAWPARYRGLSWKRLLALYYEGRREGRRIGSPSGQFGNSAE